MSDWLTWQIVDSAFPTGAFAHSYGLESAWQQGEVEGPDGLRRFLRGAILQAGHATLPLLNSAYHHPEDLVALDEVSDVFLLNTVANRASRIQGRSLVATAARIWPTEPMMALRTLSQATCAHVAPLSGAAFRTLDLPLGTAQRVALFGAARAVIAAAVRLGIAGSFEAQRLQHASAAWLEEVARRCGTLTVDDLAQTAPVVDILQAGHDRLYSRLFQS
ncbi:MAG: urease accessory UreF family protein [Vicinamibacterales bacterium]